MKKFLILILSLFVIFSFVSCEDTAYGGNEIDGSNAFDLRAWDGTSDTSWYVDDEEITEFTISTPEELAGLSDLVNKGNDFKDKIINLADDINLDSKDWTPIGGQNNNSLAVFRGSFNGNKHTIYNLKASQNKNVGLFGFCDGLVQDLNIDGIELYGNHYVGGIVGYSNGYYSDGYKGRLQIINCSVKNGTIIAEQELINGNYDNGDKVGGIVGYCRNTTDKDHETLISGNLVSNLELIAYRDVGGIIGTLSVVEGYAIVTGNSVENVTIIQDSKNGYTDLSALYLDSIIGRLHGSSAKIEENKGVATLIRRDQNGIETTIN